jgi:uncharacterized Zn-binding protein involved in type VI secretion
MGLPAAYVGCQTQHGTPLTGVGVPNVTINGRPAWTADMPHACAKPGHGVESVGMGSETVKFASKRAARGSTCNGSTSANMVAGAAAGDFLQATTAAPDQILQGSPNVMIGTPAIGVAAPANVRDFCQMYCALMHDWGTLTPADRRTRYEALLATMFARFGAPPPGVRETDITGGDASFGRRAWEVNVPRGAFATNPPASPPVPSGHATLHEIRHAEQAFLAMRHNGGRGPSDGDARARREAARRPLVPGTPEARMAHLHSDNEVTEPGFTHWQNVINEEAAAFRAETGQPAYSTQRTRDSVFGPDGYYNQPGGADARTVEQPGDCGGCP